MTNKASTAGVRPGGLNDQYEIRILLCYLLSHVRRPLTREEIEASLLSRELVNYFELSDALDKLCQRGHIRLKDNVYTVTESGRALADTLQDSVPLSVRDTAVDAVLSAQKYERNLAQHRVTVKKTDSGELIVHCEIIDSDRAMFSFDLTVPDELTAEAVRERFIRDGDKIFGCMLGLLTGDTQILKDYLGQN